MEIALHLEDDDDNSIASSQLSGSSSEDDKTKPLSGYNYKLPTLDINNLKPRHLKMIMMGTNQDIDNTKFDFWKKIPIHKIFLLHNLIDNDLHKHSYRLPLPGDIVSLLIFNKESEELYDAGYTTISSYDIKLGYVNLIDFLFTAFD